jgi:hypothetical protein
MTVVVAAQQMGPTQVHECGVIIWCVAGNACHDARALAMNGEGASRSAQSRRPWQEQCTGMQQHGPPQMSASRHVGALSATC